MPELPEVETTLRGIQPHILDQKIKQLIIRQHQLRWPIPSNLHSLIKNQQIQNLTRRGKYLLLSVETGTLLLHLGMSGSLRVLVGPATPRPGKHDHFDIEFNNQKILRYTDPRRFGALLWTEKNPAQHPLLQALGPEPLTSQLTGHYLWQRAQTKKIPAKSFIMDSKIVVGIGNIYATESLFRAGIHPQQPVNTICLDHWNQWVPILQEILQQAIQQGGTTLKDFVNSDGKPGYFLQSLQAYGRNGLPCVQCGKLLQSMQLGQRNTVFCSQCQRLRVAKTP